MRAAGLRATLAGLVLSDAAATLAPPAHAGEWIQVSCVNPDGSAASNDG